MLRFNNNKIQGDCSRREGAGGLLCWVLRLVQSAHTLLRTCLFFSFFTVLLVGQSAWAAELINNGGFEQGSIGWSATGSTGITTTGPYGNAGSTGYAFLGSVNSAIVPSSVHQIVSIPADATSATLSFYLNVVTSETTNCNCDLMDVSFRSYPGDVLLQKWATYTEADKGTNTNGVYSKKTFDVSAYKGQTVIMQFYVKTDSSLVTTFRVDDVSLIVNTAAAFPATPTGATTGGVIGTSSGPGPVTPSSTVNMSWNTVSGTGVDYSLIVTDITSNTQALNIRLPGNTYTTALTAGHQYNWQVAACNTTGCSPYTASQYFQTPGGVADTTPPTINSFAVTPSTGTQGQIFNINYTVSDSGGSGLKQISLWRANMDGSQYDPSWGQVGASMPLSGNGPVSGTFSDQLVNVGNYWYGIHVIDNAFPSTIITTERIAGLGPLQVTVAAPALPPTVTTLSATAVTSSSAILNGSVNPNGASASAYFEYVAASSSNWNITGTGSLVGTTVLPHSASLSGLAADTTYNYYLVASNSGGTNTGGMLQFTTLPVAPPGSLALTSENPSCDLSVSAVPAVRLNWTPSSYASSYQVYRNGIAVGAAKSRNASGSYELSGLVAGQSYNYKIVANNALGSANSNTITVTIPANICTSTTNAQSGSTITGTVTANGSPLSGVAINASGALNTSAVTVNGSYSFANVSTGTVTLAPSLAGYSFDPLSTAITLSTPSVRTQDFRACANGSVLSGTVWDPTALNAPISGVVTVDGNSTSYSNGSYTVPGLACGQHQVTITASGYKDYAANVNTFDSWTRNFELVKNSTVNGAQTPSGYGADPVNTATGNYIYQRRDIQLPGIGMPFVFERNYNSQAGSEIGAVSGPLGFGWTHNYNISLAVDVVGNVTVIWGDGKTEAYASNGAGGFIPQYGVFDTLTANVDGTYTLRKKDRASYNFDAAHHLASIVDRNGNTLAFTYTGANLTRVTDTAGRNIAFTYDAGNRIVSITDPISRRVQFTYDAAGDLVAAQDANNNVTHYTYDLSHQMLTVLDPRGNTVVTNVYDAANRVVNSQRDAKGGQTDYVYGVYEGTKRLTTFTDALGHATQHYHDEKFRLVKEVNANGDFSLYTYDARGNRDSVTDRNGNKTTYIYDLNGNVTGKTDANHKTSSVTYDPNTNNPLTRTDALNNTTTFTYDASGNLLSVTDALNGTATNTYNAAGQVLTTTDARGNTTTNTYDAQGNLVQVTDALGNSTLFTYDGAGRRLTKRDALNRTTTFTYDNNDNLLSTTDPNLKSTSATYDGNNNRITASDKRGNVTQFAYDVKDLLTTTTDPLLKTVVNTYDAQDRKIAVRDKNNAATQFAYDDVGNLISTTDALNQVARYTYDANGNRLSASDPLGNASSFSYDVLNRQVAVKDALGNQTSTVYDELGRVVSVINAKKQTTSFTYDKLGRLIQVTDSSGGTVKYSYDANGNRLTMTDPNGHVTSYTYDALNRLIAKTEPLGTTQYQYDAAGNRIRVTQPNGTIIRYAYDNLDRLQTVTYPDNSAVSFSYDFDGNRTGMVDALGASSAQYDPLGRMTSYTDAYGQTVGYGYDFNGNRTSLTYPGNKTVSYVYDALNRMVSVTDWLNHQTTYSYDLAGRLIGSNDPNGVATSYGFDPANRLVSLSHAQGIPPMPPTASIASYAYMLDEIGNHTHVNQTEPLPAVVTPGTANYSYDVDNRVTAINGVANTYDLNGNMTTKGTDAYIYDFEDRLQQSTLGGVASQYQYDGLGHRYAKTNAGVTTRYVLDLNGTLSKVLMETDAAGAASAYYVYGLGLISRISAAGAASYYHFDARGSTIALTDAAGTVTDMYAYDPFGNLTGSQGATPNPFKYVGQYGVMDEGNGLYYIRARYYDAQIGRFINKDPKMGNDQDGQSLNRYAYAQNNPVRFVDVSGYSKLEVSKVSANKNGSSDSNQFHNMILGATAQAAPVPPLAAAGDYVSPRRYASSSGKYIAFETCLIVCYSRTDGQSFQGAIYRETKWGFGLKAGYEYHQGETSKEPKVGRSYDADVEFELPVLGGMSAGTSGLSYSSPLGLGKLEVGFGDQHPEGTWGAGLGAGIGFLQFSTTKTEIFNP